MFYDMTEYVSRKIPSVLGISYENLYHILQKANKNQFPHIAKKKPHHLFFMSTSTMHWHIMLVQNACIEV